MRYLISAVAAVLIVAMVAGTVATLGPVSAGKSNLADMVTPKYDDKGQLLLPADFRKWVFVGSSLGLSYFGEEKEIGEQIFHHIYMQPQAYDTYVETGKFPEKTMLVMENYSAGTKDNNTAKGVVEGRETFGTMHGQFEDIRLGLEVALKDSETFEEGWAYFNFSIRGELKPAAKAFPKAACWNCHNSHGADDNVFIQYYPVLRIPYEARLKTK
jgi:hypothetical protein